MTVILVLLLSTLTILVGGNHTILPAVHAAGPSNILGFTCGYGYIDNVTGTTVSSRDGNGTILKQCNWAGDTDGDGSTTSAQTGADPLVTDPAPLSFGITCSAYPCTSPPGGGGVEVGIIITNLNDSITGFDLTVGYNSNILNAVVIDQQGLAFGTSSGVLPLAQTIDNVGGSVRVAQALLGTAAGVVGSDLVLFRIRFDVVGVGYSPLVIGGVDTLTHHAPSSNRSIPLPHTDVQGSFSTNTFFDTIVNGLAYPSTLDFNASWTYSLNMASPGITFTANAACKSCTGTLSYSWNWTTSEGIASQFVNLGQTMTLTTPLPKIARVTLLVKDQATPVPHNVTATRLLLGTKIYGPSTVATGSLNTWTGWWIGGFPPYTSVKWTLCPTRGSSTFEICNKPSIVVPTPTTVQNSTISGIGYNFTGLYQTSLQIVDNPPNWVSPGSTTLTTIASTTVSDFTLNVTGSNPAFTVSVSSNASSSDVGRSLTFSASTSYNSNYPTSAQAALFNDTFYFGDGSIATSLGTSSGPVNAIMHTYNGPGTYTVRVTVQEASSKAVTSISETSYLVVTVNSVPTASFSLSPSGPVGGASVTFTAAVTAGTSPYTYRWSFGDNSTGIGISATHTYSTPGSYNVTLTVTDASGVVTVYSHIVSVAAAPPQPPIYLYLGIGAAIAVIAAVSAVLILRRRKRSANPMSNLPSQN